MKSFALLLSLLSLQGSTAFVTQSSSQTSTSLGASRRAFFEVAVVGVAAFGLAAPAFADDDSDLAMPSEADQAAQKAAMEEKLLKKKQLQQKLQKPASFKENLANELEVRKDIKKQTKEERRDAMCQELGRGC